MTLPMAPDMELAASRTATEVATAMHMSADRIDEVRMAVVEACINAFEHSRSPDGTVRLEFAVLGHDEPERLQITIRDSGVGFDPGEIEEPTIENKLKAERKRGWGLQIIRGLMDEVEIASGVGGTTIVMRKAR